MKKNDLKGTVWEDVDKMRGSRDRDTWRAVVSAVMNLRLP
jgi:hypothetical protein